VRFELFRYVDGVTDQRQNGNFADQGTFRVAARGGAPTRQNIDEAPRCSGSSVPCIGQSVEQRQHEAGQLSILVASHLRADRQSNGWMPEILPDEDLSNERVAYGAER
jgi:hypothetical protein